MAVFEFIAGSLSNVVVALGGFQPKERKRRVSLRNNRSVGLKGEDNQSLIAPQHPDYNKLRLISITLTPDRAAIAVDRDSAVARRAW
jgi:hypothetical protein